MLVKIYQFPSLDQAKQMFAFNLSPPKKNSLGPAINAQSLYACFLLCSFNQCLAFKQSLFQTILFLEICLVRANQARILLLQD